MESYVESLPHHAAAVLRSDLPGRPDRAGDRDGHRPFRLHAHAAAHDPRRQRRRGCGRMAGRGQLRGLPAGRAHDGAPSAHAAARRPAGPGADRGLDRRHGLDGLAARLVVAALRGWRGQRLGAGEHERLVPGLAVALRAACGPGPALCGRGRGHRAGRPLLLARGCGKCRARCAVAAARRTGARGPGRSRAAHAARHARGCGPCALRSRAGNCGRGALGAGGLLRPARLRLHPACHLPAGAGARGGRRSGRLRRRLAGVRRGRRGLHALREPGVAEDGAAPRARR